MRRVGRPIKLNAITRNGHKFILWVNQDEFDYLEKEVIQTGLSKAELIRRMIQKTMLGS